MVDINSDDYHDFVIKDGKLIGEFEQMYQKSKNTPWHQDKQKNQTDIKLAIELIEEYSPFEYICDFGCGWGYFLDILRWSVGTSGCKVVGYDVSSTCCKKAKEIFPDFQFHEFDLMKDNDDIDKDASEKNNRLFAIRGTLWYVFPKIENVIKNIGNKCKEGDFLLVSQNFPPLESDFVGKEIIPNPDSIINQFSKYFTPLKTIWLEDWIKRGNDNWFVGLFSRRK